MKHPEIIHRPDIELGEPSYEVNDLKFYCTCSACPEQYDVYRKISEEKYEMVCYIRLRYGKLRADFPDVGGIQIYEAYWEDDPCLGIFPSEEEREYHLNNIAKEIVQALDAIALKKG